MTIHPVPSIMTRLSQILSSHLRLGLLKGLFPLGLPTKILYVFLNRPMCATCSAHLSRLDLRVLIKLYQAKNAMHVAHLCVTFSILL